MCPTPKKEQRTIHCNPATSEVIIKPHWFVESPKPAKYPVRCGGNQVCPLICGSQYLPELKEALENATKSIWIAIWGFDPCLSLVMAKKEDIKCTDRIGEVLKKMGGKGVDVRVLVFHGFFASFVEKTLIGYPPPPDIENEEGCNDDDQKCFATHWVSNAMAGNFKNVQLLTRNGPSDGIVPDKEEIQRELDTLHNTQEYKDAVKIQNDLLDDLHVNHHDWSLMKKVFAEEKRIKQRLNEQYHERINRERELAKRVQTTELWLDWTATDHQKMILIDHENPAKANGFVQGFNMLKDYFDTPEHLYTDPTRLNPDKPMQEIGVQVRGSVLVDMFHNFKQAWNENISWHDGTRAEKITKCPPDPAALACHSGVPAQILRTWRETGEYAIEAFYCQNLEQFICDFIYVEDQYFRYPEFADAILKRAKELQETCSKKKIYVFVVTNMNTIKENKNEQGVRADMLKALNRKDLNVEDDEWKKMQQNKKQLDNVRDAMENAGVMVQIGVLRTNKSEPDWELVEDDNPATRGASPIYQKTYAYKDIYVHSKLTIFDEACYTLGSANWNLRSMTTDTELNIAVEDKKTARKLREDLWGYHLNGILTLWKKQNPDGSPTKPEDWYEQWAEVMKKNENKYNGKQQRIANLFAYHEALDPDSDLG